MLQECGTSSIPRLRPFTVMRVAIDLYHEPPGLTHEVAEIWA
jgi:hypothetical protein